MKKVLQSFACILLCIWLATAVGCDEANTPAYRPSAMHPLTYLVLGFDDAAENTDIMFLVAFDPETPRTTVLQIPRDTYIDTGYAQNKINQIYSSRRTLGDTPKDAAIYVRDTVSDAFGIPLRAVLGIGMSGFRSTVDALGGVEISLPETVTLDTEDGQAPLTLEAGTHRIDGITAERFVRYRRGYARGDLGRIDAQKLFLSALFHAVKQADPSRWLALVSALDDTYVSDVRLISLVQTALTYLPSFKNTSLFFATLPGEAVQTNTGLWYYVVNKKGASELLTGAFGAEEGAFDTTRRMTKEDVAFDNIYFDERFSYRVYEDGELSEMHVQRK